MICFTFFTSIYAQSDDSENRETKDKTTQVKQNHESPLKPWNEICPVRGGKVKENSATVEYNDRNYGFCCPGCDSKFKKEPDKYSKNLSKDGKEFIGKK